MAWNNKHTGTRHNDTCSMVFGKPSNHDNCPRCNELKAGSEPRKGWGDVAKASNVSRLNAYCFSVPIYHARCTKETNPSCACGKMSYTD